MDIDLNLLLHQGCSRRCSDCIWDSVPSSQSVDLPRFESFVTAAKDYATQTGGRIREIDLYGIGEVLEWTKLPEAFDIILSLQPKYLSITTSGVASSAEAERLEYCLKAARASRLVVPLNICMRPTARSLIRLGKTLAIERVLIDLSLRHLPGVSQAEVEDCFKKVDAVLAEAGLFPAICEIDFGHPDILTALFQSKQPWYGFRPRLMLMNQSGQELYYGSNSRSVRVRNTEAEVGGRATKGGFAGPCPPWDGGTATIAVFPDNTLGHCFGCLGNGRHTLDDRDFDRIIREFGDSKQVAQKRYWDHKVETKHRCTHCTKRVMSCNAPF